MQSSNIIIMSEFKLCWIRIDCSGPRKTLSPFTGELKIHPLLRYLARFRQTEDLETTGIRQQRSVPMHKPVQTAVLLDYLHAWTQHQVKRVAEDNLTAQEQQFFRRHAFDRAIGTDRHKYRGLYDATHTGNPATPGAGVLCKQLKFHINTLMSFRSHRGQISNLSPINAGAHTGRISHLSPTDAGI